MKLSHIMSSLMLTASAALISASPAQQQPVSTQREMEQAIMQVYNEEIASDPTAFEALYRRAAMFYNDGMYVRALNDVDNALQHIPADDTELRTAALSLRANIYMMQRRYDKALDDLKAASVLKPDDYIISYQRANAEYECGNYTDAKQWYQHLRRINPRSVEGLVGLSRVAVCENNLGLANDYIDQAVNIAPTNPDSYLRRASVRRQLGNNTGAAQDYMSALSLGDTAGAVNGLVDLSDTDYPATVSALSEAIAQASDIGLFYYLRGTIAMSHHHYRDALGDFNTIVDRQLYNHAGVYNAIAECRRALGQYDEALVDATQATASDNGSSAAPYLATRARILTSLGRNDEAVDDARRAYQMTPDDNAVIRAYAEACRGAGDYAKASDLYGEAVFNESERADNYLYRAALLNDRLNDRDGARNLYNRLNELGPDDTPAGMRGFVKLGLGDKDGARQWADSITALPDPHGYNHYLAACLYSRLGDSDAAMDALAASLDAGYADYDSLTRADCAPLSLELLRTDTRFSELLKRYASLF